MTADDLRRRMAQAVQDEDYEAAAALRDEIARLEGSSFKRQTPGRMGLGSDQATYQPPAGWTPPPKPDLMTKGHKRRGR